MAARGVLLRILAVLVTVNILATGFATPSLCVGHGKDEAGSASHAVQGHGPEAGHEKSEEPAPAHHGGHGHGHDDCVQLPALPPSHNTQLILAAGAASFAEPDAPQGISREVPQPVPIVFAEFS